MFPKHSPFHFEISDATKREVKDALRSGGMSLIAKPKVARSRELEDIYTRIDHLLQYMDPRTRDYLDLEQIRNDLYNLLP